MINSLEKEEKIKAIAIYKFLFEYSKFEQKVKEYFIAQLDKLELNDIKRLYFYYGGMVSKKIYIDYPKETLVMQNYKFKLDDFPDFKINQIIKITKSHTNELIFNKRIKSILGRKVEYELSDSILKLIQMRNKICHNLSTLDLNDNDYIELLSVQSIKDQCKDILSDIEIKDDYHEVKLIFSNIIYMKIICDILDDS
jgi:hypothetical protein